MEVKLPICLLEIMTGRPNNRPIYRKFHFQQFKKEISNQSAQLGYYLRKDVWRALTPWCYYKLVHDGPPRPPVEQSQNADRTRCMELAYLAQLKQAPDCGWVDEGRGEEGGQEEDGRQQAHREHGPHLQQGDPEYILKWVRLGACTLWMPEE